MPATAMMMPKTEGGVVQAQATTPMPMTQPSGPMTTPMPAATTGAMVVSQPVMTTAEPARRGLFSRLRVRR
jgi:hypothetical protein